MMEQPFFLYYTLTRVQVKIKKVIDLLRYLRMLYFSYNIF